MKNIAKILIPLAVLSLSSCKTVQEGAIYKTRKYIWEVQFYQEMARTKWSDPKRTFVVTDSVSFVIEGLPKIPLKSESYLEDKKYPSQAKKHKYFSWKNSKKLYRLLEK